MKVLHAAFAKIPPSGIVKQMLWERKAALDASLPWTVRIFTTLDQFLPAELDQYSRVPLPLPVLCMPRIVQSWISLRRQYYRWLLSVESDFDVILLRYSSYDPFQLLFLRQVKTPVFLVHHSLEGPELGLEPGAKGWVQCACERLLGGPSLRNAAGLIGVTCEILKYESARCGVDAELGYVYPNGAEYESTSIVVDDRGDIPRMLFVASYFYSWHGLDLLFKSMSASNADFVVDVVGQVPDDLKQVAATDRRVILHGVLSTADIRRLAEHADIALSSFALYRKQMEEACPLKVREYLMMGLPVYGNYKETLPEEFPYFRKGPCEVARMVEYAVEMREFTRQAVSEAAQPFIDKRILLEEMYGWLWKSMGSGPSGRAICPTSDQTGPISTF